jgi:cytochrome c556
VRKLNLVMVAMVAIWAGTVMAAQAPMTVAELDKLMKDVGPAMQATGKAVKSAAFADALPSLATVKKNLQTSRRFWVEHKKADAIKAMDETLAAITAVEQHFASTSPAPTPASAMAAMNRVSDACRSCHETYRERDANDNWVIKPGSLD